MIRSFTDRDTEALFRGEIPKQWEAVASVARRKLDMLESAADLLDLRSPPGNRLEALNGDRAGQHSIRINHRWRICFIWADCGAERVEIVDYH